MAVVTKMKCRSEVSWMAQVWGSDLSYLESTWQLSWTKPSAHIYGHEVQKEILVNSWEFRTLVWGELFMSVLNFTLFLVWSIEWCAGGVFYGSSGKRFSRIIKNVKAPWFLWFLFCSVLNKRGSKTSAWFRVSLILDLRILENLTCELHFPGSSFPRETRESFWPWKFLKLCSHFFCKWNSTPDLSEKIPLPFQHTCLHVGG